LFSKRVFEVKNQSKLRRAAATAVEVLEHRRLLSAPIVQSKSFDFETAASYTTRPHTIKIDFDQDVSGREPEDSRQTQSILHRLHRRNQAMDGGEHFREEVAHAAGRPKANR
jgi:hypothetical protein